MLSYIAMLELYNKRCPREGNMNAVVWIDPRFVLLMNCNKIRAMNLIPFPRSK